MQYLQKKTYAVDTVSTNKTYAVDTLSALCTKSALGLKVQYLQIKTTPYTD